MTQMIKLSKRLQIVASFISKGAYFADIGSDHAYLPSYVCLADSQAKAIAGEVSIGPFTSAQQTVQSLSLSDVIDVKLGDGLEVIDDNITELIIAGMGGSLISSIIKNDADKLQFIERMIIQPNNNEHLVRKTFAEYNFSLTNEVIVKENKHVYEVLVAEKNTLVNHYDAKISFEKQQLFGPILMKEKPAVFIEKWQKEYTNITRKINDIKKSKHDNQAKLDEFTKQLNWIEEVIH